MNIAWKRITMGAGILTVTSFASATDVTIHLKGSQPVSRSAIRYQCDANGIKMGFPAGVFHVEYFNGAGNSLAVLPIGGKSLVFANIISGSGARYAAGKYVWWEAGERGVSLSSDSLAGKLVSECHRVSEK